MLFSLRLVLLVGLLLASSKSWAANRIAVLVTNAKGMSDEAFLPYVQEDADRLEETLKLMGNFAPANIHRFDNEAPEKVFKKLKALEEELKRNKGQEDTLLLFYYSGHADGTSLHMEGEQLEYADLLNRLKNFRAKLKIGIIDACRSGAIIGKGSSARASFNKVEVNDSLEVDGTVVVTSSRGDENSITLPSLKGSVFSRHLTSALRGAADKDANGMISLDEAFHYAHLNTRAETIRLEAGEQVPQQSLEVKEEGPIILTWLKMAGARLTLAPGQEECFITNANERRLIAQGQLEPARELHMALKPDSYVLKCRSHSGGIRKASFKMLEGDDTRATSLEFEEMSPKEKILKKGGLENLAQRCTFDIAVQSMYVERNQRTNVANLEGLLELRARFSADDVTTSPYPSPSTVMTARLGETLRMNQFVTRVSIDKTGSVPLSTELWEVEFGFQGKDDYGSQRGSMYLDCSRENDVVHLPIPFSADTLLEKSGSVIVQYVATRR